MKLATLLWALVAGALMLAAISCDAASSSISPDEQRVLEQVRKYSRAWMGSDIDAVVRLTHPVFEVRMGGREKYRESLVRLFDHFKQTMDLAHGEERIGIPSDEFVLGNARMIGVPAIRTAPGAATTPLVYVVVSYDAGQSWKIVALSCTDEVWLKALVPGYTGTPDILGIANPTVRDQLNGLSLDETAFQEVFLQGPRFSGHWPLARLDAKPEPTPLAE